MCGIAGTICTGEGRLESAVILENMASQISNRGPDGRGVKIVEEGKVGLAHTRLAIVDLSEAANQPMCDASALVHIVFNGEIYNHRELRRELNKLGNITWKTDHSDTEVIIEAYKQWGIDCISRFVGMFAFALWDSRRKKMYLVRDRLGIKPLYYSVLPGKINFASNVKALLEDPDQDRTCDKKAIFDFLSLLAVPAPDTLFAHIKKLPAGTYMEIGENGTIMQKTYWDAIDFVEKGREPEACCKKRILRLLKRSVDLRKESDVPVGIFLSGGVDSTTNLALFSKGERNVKTFTAAYRKIHGYQNENGYAREAANRYHARFFETLLDEEGLLEYLPRFDELLDDPVADPVTVSQYFIAAQARGEGVKVVQVGEGADELFAGYAYWEADSRWEKMNLAAPKAMVSGLYKRAKKFKTLSWAEDERFRRSLAGEPVYWGGRIYIHEKDKEKLFSKSFMQEVGPHKTAGFLQEPYKKFKEKSGDPLLWMTYASTKFRLPDLLLARSDKACMAVGVEARVPFLDHRLVEEAMRIPRKYKIKRHIPKYILKEAVRGLVPDTVIERKKLGFGLPFSEWYRGALGKAMMRDIQDFAKQSGFFNETELRKRLAANNLEPNVIWALYVLARWWKRYICAV